MDPDIRSDEGLTLEMLASLSLHGGNLTLINLLDTKFSCFTSRPTQQHSFFRKMTGTEFPVLWSGLYPSKKISDLAAVLRDHSWPFGSIQRRLYMHSADPHSQFSLRAAIKGD